MEGAAPESGTGKAAMPQVSYTDLEEKLARAQRERDEALEQQTATAEPPPPCRATKNSRRWRDAPIDTKCNFDRRIVVVCCPELERVCPVIVRGSTAPPAQVHQ